MSTTTSDSHGHHDWHSKDYVDEWIATDATRDEERLHLLRRVVRLLPFHEGEAIRVLDVGGGYGMLTRQVADAYAGSRITLHDFSEPMFEHARRRLDDVMEWVDFVAADLRDASWTDSLNGAFDAVVSSIAIHNVRDPDTIRRVYADIRSVVAAGGCFYNLDYVPPAGPLTARALTGRSRAPRGAEVASLEMHLGGSAMPASTKPTACCASTVRRCWPAS